MADSKISALAAATSLASTDELVIASAGVTKKLVGADLPGFEIAHVEFTASVTVSATTAAGANDVVSSGAISFDGTSRVCIEFFSMDVATGATAGSYVYVMLWDDATDLGRIAQSGSGGSLDIERAVLARRFLTPSNASHTYKIKAYRVNSNGTVVAGAGGVDTPLPGYIRIQRA